MKSCIFFTADVLLISGSCLHSRLSRKITLPKLHLSFGYQQISGKVQSIVWIVIRESDHVFPDGSEVAFLFDAISRSHMRTQPFLLKQDNYVRMLPARHPLTFVKKDILYSYFKQGGSAYGY